MDSLTPLRVYTDSTLSNSMTKSLNTTSENTNVKTNISSDTASTNTDSKSNADILLNSNNTNNATLDTIMEKALTAASLPKNEKNIAIIQELLNNNMSIDKQSIINILTQSFNNKDVSIHTLVAMNKYGIPVTNENAKYMEAYNSGEHRIINQVNDVAKAIETSLIETDDVDKIIELNKTYTQIQESYSENASSNPSLFGNEQLLTTTFKSPTDSKSIINIISIFNNDEELVQKINNGTATLRETALALNKALEHATVMDFEKSFTATEFTTNNGSPFVSRAQDLFLSPSIQNVFKEYSRMQNNNNELSSYMSDLGRATINSMIKGLPGSEALSEHIWNGNITSKDLIKDINVVMNFLPKEKAASIIKSDEYITVLKQSITSQWTITADELSEGKINEKYQNMYEQLEKLTKAISEADTRAAETVKSNTISLKSNLDFMNTLNEMFSYIQLPLRLKGQNIHSELYVMTNKKRLSKDNSSLSVLLHLDMENLKPLDVNITLKNNTVDASFYMSDKASKALIETNLDYLSINLLEKGFIFNGKVYDQRQDTNIVKRFLGNDTPTVSMKRYSFDIRT